ncbi:hypothetical protein BCT27_23650 [Enterovibrio norvegicus]|nr:hypothetical protein BCT27_23650 [Enterovibrio norvegicus]
MTAARTDAIKVRHIAGKAIGFLNGRPFTATAINAGTLNKGSVHHARWRKHGMFKPEGGYKRVSTLGFFA